MIIHSNLRALDAFHARIALLLTAALVIGVALTLAKPAHAAGVVGSGDPASCTAAALAAAVNAGGTVTFNCGPNPATITMSTALDITSPEVTIDGGGKITLQGNNTRIITHRTFGNIGSSALTLKNLTITKGRANGVNKDANGGAIRSFFEAAKPEYKPTLNIENVTFTDNDATLTSFSGGGLNAYDFGGGAIYSQGGFVTIKNSTFNGNDANNAAGGAIHILQSGLTIENTTFDKNSAIGSTPRDSLGGAIYVDGLGGENGRFSIAGSTFTGNTTYNSGGAIYVNIYENSSGLIVDRSSFIDNAVVGGERAQGGAIGGGSTTLGNQANTGNASVTITNSTFAGNSVKKSGSPEDGSGGALAFPQRAVVKITNSTFSGNKALGSNVNANGGAIYITGNTTPFEVTNSTFANNTAGWVGGAITGDKGRLSNTLIANNTASNSGNDWAIRQNCSDTLEDGGGNLQFPGFTANQFNRFNDRICVNNIAVGDPKLGALADNGGPTKTLLPQSGSPAINGGKAPCPATDQRGVARPQGGACDVGAVEVVAALSVSPSLIEAGGPNVTLTVSGSGFTQASKVLWNNQERPTTFVDSSTLKANITGADIAKAGTAQISVSNSSLPAVAVRVVEEIGQVFLPMARR
jgi:hypothetical protein